MDEITKQAKSFLNQRVQEVRNQHENLSKAEKKAEMEKLDRILFSFGDEDREWLDKHMTIPGTVTRNEAVKRRPRP